MSLFGKIMDKIFHHGAQAETVPDASAQPQAAPQASSPQAAPQAAAPQSAPVQAAPAQPVDVEAVLTEMAASKGGGGNWRTSIVDLLKLLELDSSLDARHDLATELNVAAGADGSAAENVALHKAVMQKLAENGGQVPDSLKG